MTTLGVGETLRGVAGSATAITYTVTGDEKGTSDAYKTLAQGQLPAVAGILYTTPASTATLIARIFLVNTTGGTVTVTLFINGTAAANRIVNLSIAAGGSALYTGDGWHVYDSTGSQVGVANFILTGDVTGSGTGTVATTLATVNSNVGSFGTASNVAQVTVNAKGLTTAAVNVPIQVTESQVTNLVTDLAGKQATGNYITALTADVTAAGPGSVAATLATVNANVGSFGSASSVATQTVNGKGLTTAAASVAIQITPSQVTGLTFFATLANLTGDATTAGTGATTLATVNSNVGSFGTATQVGTFTVDGKGRITAASNTTIAIPESAVTNLVTDLAGKQATGNYLTALTGDGTASGPGSAAFTLTTVNGNVGTFGTATQVPTITVNAKGLVTAAANTAIQIAESQVTNLVTDLAGKQASGNYITALTGDVTAAGPGSAAATLATVNANVGTFGSAGQTVTVTADAKGRITAISQQAVTGGANNFGVVTGNSGTANSDSVGDTIAITGTGPITTAATDTPDGLVITSAAATFTATGDMTAAEKIAANSQDGRTSTGTNPRVFRPGDFMVGNTYDPTGGSNSTSTFTAMMTAVAAWNDRCCIELAPGVFKLDHDILKNFGTNNPSFSIIGPGRGCCILLPNSAPTGDKAMITLNSGTTGSDAVHLKGFTIYNTSGTPYTTGSGILTNGADAVDVSEVGFIDLFRDIQVSGTPYTMTTAGTTALTGVSPSFTAADVGKPVSGPGITPGTTLAAQAGTTGTLSGAATVSTTATRFLGNTIKCSMQKIVSFNTNGNGNGVGIYVNNGLAGDTYIGPDVVMSDGGGTTRRRACVEIAESGHYEITQCNLTGSQRGILIDPDASQIVAFGFHTAVLCDSNTLNGMLMDTLAATSTIKNIKSVNSWYSGTTVVNGSAAAAGVKTQATGAGAINGVTFSCDRFLNNRTHGFEHAKGTDFRFDSCDMKGNSSAGSGISDGLNVAAGVSNFSTNGGKYGGTDTIPTAGNQRYGIFVAAGAGDNIKISPDDLSGNVTGPLSMGATGLNVFINGCPGLAAPYVRSASSGNVSSVTTVSNMLIPKNSTRVTSTYRLTAWYTQSSTGAATWTVRCGTTNDAVGSAATNTTVVGALSAAAIANAWGKIEFLVTFSAIGASGSVQGNGAGQQSTTASSGVQAAFGTSTTGVRGASNGTLTVDTTANQYLTLAGLTSAGFMLIHNSTIEVVNY